MFEAVEGLIDFWFRPSVKPNLNSEAGLSAGKSLILALRGAASSRL